MKQPLTQRQIANLKFPWRKSTDLPHGKAVRVSVLVSEYLKSSKYLSLGLGTKTRYLSALRLFENLVLANGKNLFQMPVNRIDYGTVDYIQAVLQHSYASGSIKICFAVMSVIWEVALRNGRAVINPWAKNDVKVHNTREVLWSYDQIHKAVDTAKALGFDTLALYILMSYETAQRPWKDLRNLKWENITTIENGVRILDFVISKTNVHIMLPLSEVALKALDNIPKISEYIFVDEKGNRLTSAAINSQLGRIRDKAMIPKNLQFRDIRRSVITEMAENGATSEEIRAITGWTSVEKIIRRYSVLKIRAAHNGMEKLKSLRDSHRFRKTSENAAQPIEAV